MCSEPTIRAIGSPSDDYKNSDDVATFIAIIAVVGINLEEEGVYKKKG
jgi:hypothetical protein